MTPLTFFGIILQIRYPPPSAGVSQDVHSYIFPETTRVIQECSVRKSEQQRNLICQEQKVPEPFSVDLKKTTQERTRER